MSVEPEILRGVPINVALEGLGRAFARGVNTENADLHAFDKSTCVEALADFISHDWHSSRMKKTVTLCLIYNGPAASVAAALAALILLALHSKAMLGVLPKERPRSPDYQDYGVKYGMWAHVVCPCIFVLVFFYWQEMLAIMGLKRKLVFVDKFCIDQFDADRKKKGILGLGGFLDKTDRLIICWTPRYFTRLWCTYEIASWLFLGKQVDSILFMPLAVGWLCFAIASFAVVSGLVYHFLLPFAASYYIVYGVAQLAVMSPSMTYIVRHLVHDLRELPAQVEAFSIADTSCYCCSVGHVTPGSGDRIPCDRKLVYRTLQGWFAVEEPSVTRSTDSSSFWHLQDFDERVRALFRAFVLHGVGPTRIKYRYIMIGVQPCFWRAIDVAVAFGEVETKQCIITLCEYLLYGLTVLPSLTKLLIRMLIVVDKVIGRPERLCFEVLTIAACSVATTLIFLILWVPLTLAGQTGNWLVAIPVFCAYVVLTAALYPESLACARTITGKKLEDVSKWPSVVQGNSISGRTTNEDTPSLSEHTGSNCPQGPAVLQEPSTSEQMAVEDSPSSSGHTGSSIAHEYI